MLFNSTSEPQKAISSMYLAIYYKYKCEFHNLAMFKIFECITFVFFSYLSYNAIVFFPFLKLKSTFLCQFWNYQPKSGMLSVLAKGLKISSKMNF